MACSDNEGRIRDSDTGYFPLQRGQFHVYAVQEIHHSSASEPLALSYEMMTEVVDSFPSAPNQHTYVVHRSKRADEGQPWQPLDTWSVRKNEYEVIVSEGNTSFVKARFPVSPGTRWNGNALNALGADEYAFADVDEPMQIGGMTFEKTVTIEQERNGDQIVFRDERHEVYARGVGLVYREIIQLNYCTDDACLGQQVVEEGIEIRMAITQYGKH